MDNPRLASGGGAADHQAGGQSPSTEQFGFAMQPGERMLHFQRREYGWLDRKAGAAEKNPRAYAITDRRLVVVEGDGTPTAHELKQFDNVQGIRAQAGNAGQGGLLASAVGGGIVAGLNAKAAGQDKVTPEHWDRVLQIVLSGPGSEGVTLAVKPEEARAMGPILAMCVLHGAAGDIQSMRDGLQQAQARARSLAQQKKTIRWPYLLAVVCLVGAGLCGHVVKRAIGLKKGANARISRVQAAKQKAPAERTRYEAAWVANSETGIARIQGRIKKFDQRILIFGGAFAVALLLGLAMIILGVRINRRRKANLPVS